MMKLTTNTKHRAVSLRQLSFLSAVHCIEPATTSCDDRQWPSQVLDSQEPATAVDKPATAVASRRRRRLNSQRVQRETEQFSFPLTAVQCIGLKGCANRAFHHVWLLDCRAPHLGAAARLPAAWQPLALAGWRGRRLRQQVLAVCVDV